MSSHVKNVNCKDCGRAVVAHRIGPSGTLFVVLPHDSRGKKLTFGNSCSGSGRRV